MEKVSGGVVDVGCVGPDEIEQWLCGDSDALLLDHGLEPEMMMLLPLEELTEIIREKEVSQALRAFVSGIHYARLCVAAGTNCKIAA